MLSVCSSAHTKENLIHWRHQQSQLKMAQYILVISQALNVITILLVYEYSQSSRSLSTLVDGSDFLHHQVLMTLLIFKILELSTKGQTWKSHLDERSNIFKNYKSSSLLLKHLQWYCLFLIITWALPYLKIIKNALISTRKTNSSINKIKLYKMGKRNRSWNPEMNINFQYVLQLLNELFYYLNYVFLVMDEQVSQQTF